MVTRIVQGWKEIITKGTIAPVQVAGGSINVIGIGGTTVKAAGTVTALPAFTRATILTAIADINFLNLSIVSVSGEDYAKFYLLINGNELDIRRTGPSRNLEFNYTGAPIELAYGDIVQVQVEHYNPSALPDFDCTLYGFGDVHAQLIEPLSPFLLGLTLNQPTLIGIGFPSTQEGFLSVLQPSISNVTFPAIVPFATSLEASSPTPTVAEPTLQVALSVLAPSISITAEVSPLTSFVNAPTPWPAIHSLPATLPAQLVIQLPTIVTIETPVTLGSLLSVLTSTPEAGPDALTQELTLTENTPDLLFYYVPAVNSLAVSLLTPLIAIDLPQDATLAASITVLDPLVFVDIGSATFALTMGIHVDKTVAIDTLELLMSDPRIDKTLKVAILELLMSDPRIDKTLKVEILELLMSDPRIDRTLSPLTLELIIDGVILDRLLTPQTFELIISGEEPFA